MYVENRDGLPEGRAISIPCRMIRKQACLRATSAAYVMMSCLSVARDDSSGIDDELQAPAA